MIGSRKFLICDVFARRAFEGNQLAVFPDAAGLTDEEMQTLAREMHFSETTFILGQEPTERGFPVRIFTPAREVPFAGHPTLGTAFVLWDRFLNREGHEVRLDLPVGSVPVEVVADGERLVMTQPAPQFGSKVGRDAAAELLGIEAADISNRYPAQEVSTGLWFLIVPVGRLETMKRIKLDPGASARLFSTLEARAVLAFCPEAEDPECDFHVRVFCDFYDVPEDPATGSANGCLCAWLVKHRYFGTDSISVRSEQGIEIGRPSRLYLEGEESGGRITVRVGGRVIPVGRGVIGPDGAQ